MTVSCRWTLLLSVLLLSACGASGVDELRQWTAQQKAQIKPRIKPIAEPKKFQPEHYEPSAANEPFSKQKLTLALKSESTSVAASNALIAPEMARRKEALEAFPLDSMTMVGSLARAGQSLALLKVANLLHQVRLGNHLGQNYGRVTKITETELTLREIVQDAVGEWIERTATLQLQEGTK